MTHAARRPALTPGLGRMAPDPRRNPARHRFFGWLDPDGDEIGLIQRIA
jgi:hypothetical protein